MRRAVVVLAGALCLQIAVFAAPGAPTALRCEYQKDPIGIDTRSPRLSWEVTDERRGAIQTAYQVLVASSLEKLGADEADVWDSGERETDQSHLVRYRGPLLRSARAYYWKVRTWDVDGQASEYSEPAKWEMGLLSEKDWKARWMAATPPDPESDADPPGWKQGNWVWHPSERGNAPVHLRRAFDLPEGEVSAARIRCTADNAFTLYVNGEEVGSGDDWGTVYDFRVEGKLRPGSNVLAVRARNEGGPCGFRLGMRVDVEGSEAIWIISDESWLSQVSEEPGWETLAHETGGWQEAAVLGGYGCAPWGTGGPSQPMLRSQLARKEFSLPARPVRARAYVSGLGAYQLYVNGQRVSQDVLTPGWTRFDKRVQYQVYDVTAALRSGDNAMGVVLGNGWWHGRIGGESGQRGRESLRFIVQLQAELPDGMAQWINSDLSWRAADSPILSDCIYDGETYDARLQQPGWSTPGFDDSKWRPVSEAAQPVETLVCQAKETIQPIEWLRPVAITEPEAGVYVYDFGQNLTGWCRLTYSGKAGQTVTLRHAEVLNPDGTIYTDNLRSAQATDRYTLRGGPAEVWEPRFTYHGFRYVEVTGLGDKAYAGYLAARMICSAAPQIGHFECSNALVNSIQHNILWGQRGNMYSVPTDCPQRDERLGWTGDTQMFCPTSCYNLDMARFFTKWMADIRDCQGEDGAVRDVNPTNGGGPAAPAWGDACVIVPYWVWRHYGDTRILEDNYDCMRRWVGYMTANSEDYLYERDGYGDWIAVVGSPAKPISAAYYYYDCVLLSQMAEAIGREGDAATYAELAEKIREAFNRKYFDEEKATYPGGTQTSYLLPLHFGLVPRYKVDAVVDNLVKDILDRQVHLSTGFLGTGYINPVLTASGHHDLAWLLATQSTYPSWGYMSKRGATTIWELWNSDTAGPGMNSRNHFCLGAVGEWFYESLAGIRAVDAGYQTFSVRPRPSGELTWVNCSLHSPYGQIVSNWKLADGDLTLDVTVPVNTSAVICVPTFGQDVQVSESGTPVAEAAGVTSQGMEDGCLVYGVGAGKYRFVAKSVGLPPAHRYPIPEPPPQIGELRDDFSTARIDEEKWQVLDMGLESSQPCGIEAKQEDGGLWVSGRTSVNYWSGKTLLSRGAFSVQPGGKLEVEVTRASLEAEGSGARSSLWMWVDASNYLMFSQDTEHGHWSYNLNGRKGPGEGLLDDEDGGSRVMALVHDGDSVHILLDGRELADVKVPWTDGIRVGLTGQARMEGDSVSVRFRGFRAEG